MKTIVRKDNNVSLYLYPDDKEITLESNRTVIGPTDNPELYIADLNSGNAKIIYDIDDKADYWGNKYKVNEAENGDLSWVADANFKGANSLSADISASINEIGVKRSNPFTSSGTIQIGTEQITYTGITGNVLTGCTRGANSTTASSHSADEHATQI
tara:strand:+ start:131 stop:601 length:471 start_codon:yes stop_codon:yes gene_type:complete